VTLRRTERTERSEPDQQDQGYGRADLQDDDIRPGGADHQHDETGSGQPSNPRHQQADRSGGLADADEQPQSLAGAQVVEHGHHGRVTDELE
jgi:hypothetical protein